MQSTKQLERNKNSICSNGWCTFVACIVANPPINLQSAVKWRSIYIFQERKALSFFLSLGQQYFCEWIDFPVLSPAVSVRTTLKSHKRLALFCSLCAADPVRWLHKILLYENYYALRARTWLSRRLISGQKVGCAQIAAHNVARKTENYYIILDAPSSAKLALCSPADHN